MEKRSRGQCQPLINRAAAAGDAGSLVVTIGPGLCLGAGDSAVYCALTAAKALGDICQRPAVQRPRRHIGLPERRR